MSSGLTPGMTTCAETICAPLTALAGLWRRSSEPMLDAASAKMSRFSDAWSNDIEFSGERKRVRCNEGLGGDLEAA